MLESNIETNLTVRKQISSDSFKENIVYKLFTYKSCKVKIKLATVVDGDQKAPFSIATTQRC